MPGNAAKDSPVPAACAALVRDALRGHLVDDRTDGMLLRVGDEPRDREALAGDFPPEPPRSDPSDSQLWDPRGGRPHDTHAPQRPSVRHLVDTDWIIDGLGGRMQARTVLEEHRAEELAVSIVTLGEVYEGAYISLEPAVHIASFKTFSPSSRCCL